MSPTSSAHIDIAIVSWNTAKAALDAAEAFSRSAGVSTDLTIVDNASQPSSRRLLAERLEPSARMKLVLLEKNLGYGAAANLALREKQAEVVCISNADLSPHADALARLSEAVLADPAAGMAGPNFDGGTQHYHGALPGPVSLLARTFLGSAGRGRSAESVPATTEVEQVSGACFVMRREVWERVGGFDPGYFLWYEDVDLAKRLIDLGYRNLVVGGAVVRHNGAASFSQIDRATAQAIRLASLERYISVHHRRWGTVAAPLLSVARLLRARGARGGGAQALGSVGSGDEADPAVPS